MKETMLPYSLKNQFIYISNLNRKHYISFIECPPKFKELKNKRVIMENTTRTINFYEDGYDIEECTRVCYELGCSHLSFIYEPIFHQISNRIHLIPKKCKLYNGTVTLTPKVSSDLLKNEILCESTIPGTILYFDNQTRIVDYFSITYYFT